MQDPLWPTSQNIGNKRKCRILYDPPPRILEVKGKINKWDLIKIKSFYTTKETISKVKRQPSEWEKIIANEATDKELIFILDLLSFVVQKLLILIRSHLFIFAFISNILGNSSSSIPEKINNPIKKMGQRTKQTFL